MGVFSTPLAVVVVGMHLGIAGSTTPRIKNIDTKIFYKYVDEMENGTDIVNNP